eukprot:3735-Heterococcus_DN1.PRE.1
MENSCLQYDAVFTGSQLALPESSRYGDKRQPTVLLLRLIASAHSLKHARIEDSTHGGCCDSSVVYLSELMHHRHVNND